jgi:hypothetical protein
LGVKSTGTKIWRKTAFIVQQFPNLFVNTKAFVALSILTRSWPL